MNGHTYTLRIATSQTGDTWWARAIITDPDGLDEHTPELGPFPTKRDAYRAILDIYERAHQKATGGPLTPIDQ